MVEVERDEVGGVTPLGEALGERRGDEGDEVGNAGVNCVRNVM